MPEPDLQTQLEEIQRRYAALAHELENIKHHLRGPHVELKLAIFDKLPMPVWACDRDCRIVFWNSGAARLYGFTTEEAIGQDFVDLFVHKPEREKARLDCIDIIDNDRPIKNMAEDIDKHGNTRKLVTQCFALYDVEGHSGLQVEISYEVQDIERLQRELSDVQGAFQRTAEEGEALERKLLDVTRTRALQALYTKVLSVKNSLRERGAAANSAAYSRDTDKAMIRSAQAKIKRESADLIVWEREKRTLLMSYRSLAEIEALIAAIELDETFDI